MTTFVKGSEKAVLLSPNQVLALELHSDAVNEIEVRERDNTDRLKRPHNREAIRELRVVDKICIAANAWRHLILFDFAVHDSFQVENVEARRGVFLVRHQRTLAGNLINYPDRTEDLITDHVDV